MQIQVSPAISASPALEHTLEQLKRCVHCGFCNATCPTYQLQGEEADGPRGRIYLVKQLLEGDPATPAMQQHLDRCLSCRACETTCPSGVAYHQVLDSGRQLLATQLVRPWHQRWLRSMLLHFLPYPERLRRWLPWALRAKALLPRGWQNKLPESIPTAPETYLATSHSRRMLLLEGCVQSVLAPHFNQACSQVLDKLGISTLAIHGCCGALHQHLDAHQAAQVMARELIDRCWPHVEDGIEAIVSTASGCGLHVREYPELLREDDVYAAKAIRIANLCRDIGEIVTAEDCRSLKVQPRRIAWQAPCTLQHGLHGQHQIRQLLQQLGFVLTEVADEHLCCGSAGSYALLQPELSGRLQQAKLQALQQQQPELIVTANIGCWTQLQERAKVPVLHWIELLSECY